MKLKKVISGGQTGVDQMGLACALVAGLETGGMAPKGYRTDEGPNPSLRDLYGLEEHFSSSYPPRTHVNAMASDATVWFGDVRSPGGQLTQHLVLNIYKKRWVENPTAEVLVRILSEHNVEVLNVAGNRRRTNPEATDRACEVLTHAFKLLREREGEEG